MKTYGVVNVTELDRLTPKKALPEQNFNYNEFEDYEYITHMEPHEGTGMILVRREGEHGYVRTSTVNKIEETFGELIVETRNTVYFLEEIINDNN